MQVFNYFRGSSVKEGDPRAVAPLFVGNDFVDVRMYVNTNSSGLSVMEQKPAWEILDTPLLVKNPQHKHLEIDIPQDVLDNGTMWLHTFVCRAGMFRDYPREPGDPEWFVTTHPITVHKPKRRVKQYVNLLEAEQSDIDQMKKQHEELDSKPAEIVNYWRPNMTIHVIDNFAPFYPRQLNPLLQPLLKVYKDENPHRFYPFIYHNTFWLLNDKLVEVNATNSRLPLTLEWGSIGSWKWQIFTQLDQSFDMQKSMGLNQDGDSDEFKRILTEGNPYFLALTFSVSLLHSVFDALAFKNDIGFWKSNKSMEGLSARTVVINCVCQLIIALYLLDNDTSIVVLASALIGTVIEFWKLTKVFRVTFDARRPLWRMVKFEDRESYVSSKTKEHDEAAMRYLSYAAYPLVGCYAVYSLAYQTHKSWYSWVLSSLVGAVYMFGFILMCPQLYLNYKLKSVAHLPWRQMTYKFLNTIIDDLFAFVIKMPLLHRLAVFRDDLVFLVFLYQRWIYRVDPTRVNEFGFSATDAGKDGDEAQESSDTAQGYDKGTARAVQNRDGLRRRKGEAERAGTSGAAGPSTTDKKKT
ncbi:unnamed protein product [Pedinophyceae sp. YPF-701]|nr:unnamed protein product [Pedinophyceae sp. YPF-701]